MEAVFMVVVASMEKDLEMMIVYTEVPTVV